LEAQDRKQIEILLERITYQSWSHPLQGKFKNSILLPQTYEIFQKTENKRTLSKSQKE